MRITRILAAACLAAALTPSRSWSQDSPNIVMIIGDDLGWPDLGFMASSRTLATNQGAMPIQDVVETPNLNAIAASGVVFRRGFATASACIASLRTLLSAGGLHSFQWDAMTTALQTLPGIGNIPIRTESPYMRTLPRELGRVGYASWEGGKMWEGSYEMAGFTHGLATSPTSDFFTSVGDDFGRRDWSTASCGSTAAPGVPCPALAPLRAFLDDVAGRRFFAWIAPMLPHVPYNAPAAYRGRYEALGLQAYEVDYLANVRWLDELIGEVLDELDARGLRENTLLVYVTDNGWGLGFQLLSGTGRGKGTPYELGFRTPIVFSWPGRVPAGVVYDDLVSTTDIVPTLYDYAGADPVPGQQGQSLRGRIEGGAPVGRSELIGVHTSVGAFLRTDTWRYVRFASDGREELYRIDVDPFELVNVAAANPELVTTFAARVDQWLTDRMAPPERTEVTGRLVDANGTPLSGARVALIGTPLDAIAGPDGFFRIGPLAFAPYTLKRARGVTGLRAMGFSDRIPLLRVLLAGGLHVPLTGTPRRQFSETFGTRVDGTLTDGAGTPLGGEIVKVAGRTASGRVVVHSLTQPDGTYRVEHLAAGLYRVTATVPSSYQRVVLRDVPVAESVRMRLDLVAGRL